MNLLISFGQGHSHTINEQYFDKDCIAVVPCTNYKEGRSIAFKLFGEYFATSYTEEQWPEIAKYFPRGKIVITQTAIKNHK